MSVKRNMILLSMPIIHKRRNSAIFHCLATCSIKWIRIGSNLEIILTFVEILYSNCFFCPLNENIPLIQSTFGLSKTTACGAMSILYFNSTMNHSTGSSVIDSMDNSLSKFKPVGKIPKLSMSEENTTLCFKTVWWHSSHMHLEMNKQITFKGLVQYYLFPRKKPLEEQLFYFLFGDDHLVLIQCFGVWDKH